MSWESLSFTMVHRLGSFMKGNFTVSSMKKRSAINGISSNLDWILLSHRLANPLLHLDFTPSSRDLQ